jgi:hypothetical protein
LGHELERTGKLKIIFAKYVGSPEGKRQRRRLGCRGDCNIKMNVNPLNAELNPICHLLALLGVHHFLHVSRIRVKSITLSLIMSYIYIYIYIYIYGAPILDVSRSHTTTQHSR